MPVLISISQAPLVFLDAENNGNTHNTIKIMRSVFNLVVLMTLLGIVVSTSGTVQLDYFAYVDIAVEAIFVLITLYITVDGLKPAEVSISRFVLGKDNLRMLKMGVFGVVAEKMALHFLIFIPELLNHILPLANIFNFTQMEDRTSTFAAFAAYETFEPICTAVSQAMKTTLIQILTPNNQMKRYERVTAVILSGFLLEFTVNAIINIALYCAISSIIPSLYFDTTYNMQGSIFTNSHFDPTRLSSVANVAIEGITRPIYSFVMVTANICQMKDLLGFAVAIKYIAVIVSYIITYYLDTQEVIDELFWPNLTVDLACILPYLLIL